ncbi:MAG: putative transrane protein [Rhodocyclaceae bacterium]|nr:putative transrane protein [Rhodocyclaceae bacterium]
MKYQRGFTLSGLMVWGFVLVVVAALGLKVVPSAIEYYKIQKDIKAVAQNAPQGATVADIKRSFSKYAEIDHLDFSPDQLDVSKEGGQLVISFGYEKRINLFRNVSLVIEYQGSSASGG